MTIAKDSRPLLGMTVVIMGAVGYSRLGSGIALQLAAKGCDVAVQGSAGTEHAVEELCQEIRSHDVESLALICDPTDAVGVAAAFHRVAESFGTLDVMVGAMSVVPAGPLIDADVGTWNTALRVNLKAPFITGREAARIMVDLGGGGRILFLSTHAARLGIPGLGVYAASQTGLAGMIRTMALELADAEISVNLLSVGSMREDPGFDQGDKLNDGASLLQQWSGGFGTSLGRPEGEAPRSIPLRHGASIADVAEAVAYLVSSTGGLVTGQVVDLTGGQVIGR